MRNICLIPSVILISTTPNMNTSAQRVLPEVSYAAGTARCNVCFRLKPHSKPRSQPHAVAAAAALSVEHQQPLPIQQKTAARLEQQHASVLLPHGVQKQQLPRHVAVSTTPVWSAHSIPCMHVLSGACFVDASPSDDLSLSACFQQLIMDGNSRWATRQGLPAFVGHERGVAALRAAVVTARQWGIPALTVSMLV